MNARKLRTRPRFDPVRARRLARRHSRWLASKIRGTLGAAHNLWRRPWVPPRTSTVQLRFDRERASRGLKSVATASVRAGAWVLAGLCTCLRALLRHRQLLAGVLLRACWWGALLLLVTAGPAVFDPTYSHSVEQAVMFFLMGLSICAFVLLASASRHLRWAAAGLGLAHGGLAVAVTTALGPGILGITL